MNYVTNNYATNSPYNCPLKGERKERIYIKIVNKQPL